MDIEEAAKKLEGLQTIDTIAKILDVSRRTSINIVWRLRKYGLVENIHGSRIRMYRIKTIKKPDIGFKGIYEVINENSKVKLLASELHRIHDHKLTVEEAIVRAIKTREFRTILASLGLFNKIKDWTLLYKFAKEANLTNEVGALYDTAKTIVKVRRIDDRIKKALKKKINKRHIIENIKSKNFQEIEKEWNIFIPFNKADLMRYKE